MLNNSTFVIHLTTPRGKTEILRDPSKLRRRERETVFYQEFDEIVATRWPSFKRTGCIFAYPDVKSINRGRVGSLHQGETPVLIEVDPKRVFVADAFLAEAAYRYLTAIKATLGHWQEHGKKMSPFGDPPSYADIADAYEQRQRTLELEGEKMVWPYFETAITLQQYQAHGNPGFIYPEVIIPEYTYHKVYAAPDNFSLETRKIEDWELALREKAFARYKIPKVKDHPWGHTLAVVEEAIRLAQIECPALINAATVGGYLHDIGRSSDGSDPQHPLVGAAQVHELATGFLTDQEIETLEFAICHHSDRFAPGDLPPTTQNYPALMQGSLLPILAGVIWDADRIQLLRFGQIDINYFSTASAKAFVERLHPTALKNI